MARADEQQRRNLLHNKSIELLRLAEELQTLGAAGAVGMLVSIAQSIALECDRQAAEEKAEVMGLP